MKWLINEIQIIYYRDHDHLQCYMATKCLVIVISLSKFGQELNIILNEFKSCGVQIYIIKILQFQEKDGPTSHITLSVNATGSVYIYIGCMIILPGFMIPGDWTVDHIYNQVCRILYSLGPIHGCTQSLPFMDQHYNKFW